MDFRKNCQTYFRKIFQTDFRKKDSKRIFAKVSKQISAKISNRFWQQKLTDFRKKNNVFLQHFLNRFL